jgi:hypothetical protein
MTTSSTFGKNPLGYQGIDLNSVANVLPLAARIPSTLDVQPYGTIWPYSGTSPVTLYISEGAGNWGTFVIPSGDLLTLSGDSGTATPSANNITLSGGTTGIVATGAGAAITLSGTLAVANGGTGAATLTDHGVLLGSGTGAITPLAVAATGSTLMGVTGADPAFTGSPSFSGSVTAATTLTATLGNITATNGNLNLAGAGNKILIHATTAASDSVGTTAAMTAGSIVVACTAVTASSIIFLTHNTAGGTMGNLTYGSINPGVGFKIDSDNVADTSTVNYLIIN